MTRDQVENLLQAWLDMEMSIRGNRVLTEMSFNEMIVCHFLLRYQRAGENATATDLCDRMHLLKSQMNSMLTELEQRGYVTRERSENDRRKSYIVLTEAGAQEFKNEHRRIIEIMEAIIRRIGEDDVDHLTEMLNIATRAYQHSVGEDA